MHACAAPVALLGAVQVGLAALALLKLPGLPSVEQVAVHAYVSVWSLRESAAVTLAATLPPDATGFGAPLGPLVSVNVCGTELTVCRYEPL
jgi:hypothetical protein